MVGEYLFFNAFLSFAFLNSDRSYSCCCNTFWEYSVLGIFRSHLSKSDIRRYGGGKRRDSHFAILDHIFVIFYVCHNITSIVPIFMQQATIFDWEVSFSATLEVLFGRNFLAHIMPINLLWFYAYIIFYSLYFLLVKCLVIPLHGS